MVRSRDPRLSFHPKIVPICVRVGGMMMEKKEKKKEKGHDC